MSSNKLKMVSPRQLVGKYHEIVARDFLIEKGLVLIKENWLKPKIGEIDLIMLETNKSWNVVVFVEVRARKSDQYGTVLESITKAKQKKIIKAAQCFLQEFPQYQNYECRFDIIGFKSKNHQPIWISEAFIVNS